MVYEKCASCFYFDELQERKEGGRGICRRFPPRAILEVDHVDYYWSVVYPDDFCGEHVTATIKRVLPEKETTKEKNLGESFVQILEEFLRLHKVRIRSDRE